MNYRDKIQKFSIRKYTVGTFSTVIATLVFLGLNTSQAQATETNQPASVVKQKQQSSNEQTENGEAEMQNSQDSQSLDTTHVNEQPINSITNSVDTNAAQPSTSKQQQTVSQNTQVTKETKVAAKEQSDISEGNLKHNESRSADYSANANEVTHVDSHRANVVTASDVSDNSGNVHHDRNELQAFFDANYHDYRFIDRENADSGTFKYVKGIFDKINMLLGNNGVINNNELQLAYKELENAVALIRTMPKRQAPVRQSSRIEERSVQPETRSNIESRAGSGYANAKSSYYVAYTNDGSGYPVGTYINASNRRWPFNLPKKRYNLLNASDAKEIALMTVKQVKDGYQWIIKFNKGHWNHGEMTYWFALPSNQTPVDKTTFITVGRDGSNVNWSTGVGSAANQPLNVMWNSGVSDNRSNDFKIINKATDTNSLRDLARDDDFIIEEGATEAAKLFGRQIFQYINGDTQQTSGVDKIYRFKGYGDASYTISFKTQGPTTTKLYYAAGGKAFENNQKYMYSQLFEETNEDLANRLAGLTQVVDRTYHLNSTKLVESQNGNVSRKKILDNTNLNTDDFLEDVSSYVRTPSSSLIGFYPSNADVDHYRQGGINPLDEYALNQLFSDSKLAEAARTGNKIPLVIGFNYSDGAGNPETLKRVYLTVKPEVQHNIKFFENDNPQNLADSQISRQAGHPVFSVNQGQVSNSVVDTGSGSFRANQPLRINLTSNENFADNDWEITGLPSSLRVEDAVRRTRGPRERNLELVGNLAPGDYFATVRFGRKEQPFEIRVKPNPPTITTTAEELRGQALKKVPITVSGVPLDLMR